MPRKPQIRSVSDVFSVNHEPKRSIIHILRLAGQPLSLSEMNFILREEDVSRRRAWGRHAVWKMWHAWVVNRQGLPYSGRGEKLFRDPETGDSTIIEHYRRSYQALSKHVRDLKKLGYVQTTSDGRLFPSKDCDNILQKEMTDIRIREFLPSWVTWKDKIGYYGIVETMFSDAFTDEEEEFEKLHEELKSLRRRIRALWEKWCLRKKAHTMKNVLKEMKHVENKAFLVAGILEDLEASTKRLGDKKLQPYLENLMGLRDKEGDEVRRLAMEYLRGQEDPIDEIMEVISDELFESAKSDAGLRGFFDKDHLSERIGALEKKGRIPVLTRRQRSIILERQDLTSFIGGPAIHGLAPTGVLRPTIVVWF